MGYRLLIIAVMVSAMAACGNENQNSTNASNSVENRELIALNAQLYEIGEAMYRADTSTRQGEAEYVRNQKLRDDTVAAYTGKHVSNWPCTAFKPLGAQDLTYGLDNITTTDHRQALLICSGDKNANFSRDLNQTINAEITLVIDEVNARRIGKVYNNDKIQFTGTIKSLSVRGPKNYYMTVVTQDVSVRPN